MKYTLHIILIVIVIILAMCYTKKEQFGDKPNSEKPGIVTQPLFHPNIFQNVQSNDKYHSLFDTTKTINGANNGGLAAQAI
jgi:hypothetical protein